MLYSLNFLNLWKQKPKQTVKFISADLQLFISAAEEVCIKSLVRPLRGTNVLEYSFGKQSKQIKCTAQNSL